MTVAIAKSRAAPRTRPTAGVIVILSCTAAVLILFKQLAGSVANGEMLHAFYYDDFYYYAQVARHIQQSGISSFDGITLTNGYQPLWMASLVELARITEIQPGEFFLLVYGVAVALHAAGTIALSFLLRALFPRSSLTYLAVVFYFFFGLFIAVSGMEAVLLFALFPLLAASWFGLVARFGAPSSVRFGVLGAVFVLARLDAALFVALLFGAAAAYWYYSRFVSSRRAIISLTIAAVVCGLPLLAYLIWNVTVFGLAFPVSGLAKSLRTTPGFSFGTLASLLVPHNALGFILPTGVLLLVVAALPAVLTRLPRASSLDWFLTAVFLFPFMFYLVTALRSGWTIWPWYYFPLILALPFAFLALTTLMPFAMAQFATATVGRWLAAMAALALASGVSAKSLNGATIYDEMSLLQEKEIAPFVKDHPGVYGIGDSAGLFGFLLGQPVVQLEGLVADRQMIDFIAKSADLADVLAHYGIRYYVTIGVPPDAAPLNGCWTLQEPMNSGPPAPKMHGRICAAPLLDRTSTYAGFRRRLLVFDAADMR